MFYITSGKSSVRREYAFAGTLTVFSAWNSASFKRLLTRFSSDIGTLNRNATLANVSPGIISASTH